MGGAARLVVEVDGHRYHRGQLTMTEDLLRDRRLGDRGFEILRFAYWQVVEKPDAVVALIRGRL